MASLALRHVLKHLSIYGPRFQNGDLRIRLREGQIMENLMFYSKIVNSGVQRSNIRKTDPRHFSAFSLFFCGGGGPKG